MATIAKVEANQRNALKSTGPRTPAGKSVVASNAVKHGLLSREVLLPEEDRSAFRALAVGLLDSLQAVGALEHLLVDGIVAAAWRLRRVHVIETGLCEPANRWEGVESFGTRFIQDCRGSESFLKLSQYEAAIDRSLFQALHELERRQTRRSGGDVSPPVALDVDVTVQDNGG